MAEQPDLKSVLKVEAPETPQAGFRDKAHLKAWLMASDRQFLVLNTADLVDAMPFPDGVELVQQVIAAYSQHRAMRESGWVHDMPESLKARFTQRGQVAPSTMPVMVDEAPTLEEIDAAILQLTAFRAATVARLESIHARKAG